MLIKMEVESSYTGKLQVNVVTRENVPVRDATVTIAASDSPNNIIERLTTNSSGQTETIDLPAPPIELSLNEANTTRPYTTYNIRIEALGYETEFIENAEKTGVFEVKGLPNCVKNYKCVAGLSLVGDE